MSELKIAIIACCKMEEHYIKEWLDWHLFTIGVNHIYLCDNNDAGYLPTLSSVVEDYVKQDLVTVYEYHGILPIQPKCYDDIYNLISKDYDWVTMIDVDEFIVLPKFNNNLREFLELDHIKNCDYFMINWRLFGDNNLIEYDGRSCMERFVSPVNTKINPNGMSHIVKSFVNCRYKSTLPDDKTFILCHHDILMHESELNKIDVLGNKISEPGKFFYPAKEYKCDEAQYYKAIFNIFSLNHYYTKTIEEYIKYKIYRGDTLLDKTNLDYPYTLNKFFKYNKINKSKIRFIKEKYPQLYNLWDKERKYANV